jgi:hypothetical protein
MPRRKVDRATDKPRTGFATWEGIPAEERARRLAPTQLKGAATILEKHQSLIDATLLARLQAVVRSVEDRLGLY